MRTIGFLLDKAARLHEARIPDPRMARVNQSRVRRIADDIADVFDYACLTNDLDAAADLVALMEKWHARRPYSDEQERRIGSTHLKRMHGELGRRRIMAGQRGGVP